MTSLAAGLREIASAIGRRKGTFVLAPTSPDDAVQNPFALAVGSWRAVQVDGGFIVTLGLSREQVEKLRTMCDEALTKSQMEKKS